MAAEIWRDVPSLPEYQASSLGRIRRKRFEAPMPNGGIRHYGGHAWYGTWTDDEPRPLMRFRGKTYRVSILVCEAFHGPKPQPRAIAMHADHDPQNNRPTNLSWSTQKVSLNRQAFIDYCRSRTGDHSPIAIHRARMHPAIRADVTVPAPSS